MTTIYVCTKCDAQSAKWTGQCLECGAWGTVIEGAGAAAPTTAARPRSDARPAALTPLSAHAPSGVARTPTGIEETDRVLGGGIVPGSVTLIGGEPGIGKSTLSLLIAARYAADGKKAIYVSGEESAGQVKMRADRLGVKGGDGLLFLSATDVDVIIATIEKERPALAVIDSVQMLKSETLPSSDAGGANQLRAATARLVGMAKATDVPLLLIGHVTKDGNVAGPKTLEHLVDAVLSFEGERSSGLRILRSLKNRFGSTDEAGIFAMESDGLREVRNPSAYLLEHRREGAEGDVISCILEGSRPILVEIQALVRKTSFGYPARRASGMDLSRLEMLIAVLGAKGGIDLGQHDVYVNVVGGLRLKEPSADLAVLMALASAYRSTALPEGTAVWGEVGLGGEIRPAAGTEKRLAEARALGMRTVMAPMPKNAKIRGGPEVRDTGTVREALSLLAPAPRATKVKTAA